MARPTAKDRDAWSQEKALLNARIENQKQTITDMQFAIDDRNHWQHNAEHRIGEAEADALYHQERANRYKAYADKLAGVK